MFSLIISIIAIALVAALALASIYYGGSAFQEGSADAEASTVVNQGQQIQGAFTLADVNEFKYSEATGSTLLARLVSGGFMKEAPVVRGKEWSAVKADGTPAADGTATLVRVDVASEDICKKIEKRFDNVEDLDTAATPAEDQAFGCHNKGGAGVYTAYYKL